MAEFISGSNDSLLNLNLSKEEVFTGYYDAYKNKIYRSVVEWDSLGTKGVGDIPHKISGIRNVIGYDVIAYDVDGNSYKAPMTYYSSGTGGTFYSTYFIINRQNIHYASSLNWQSYHFVATIYYTKH